MRLLSTLLQEKQHFRLSSILFIRLLALIYFAAFVSLSIQITGLIGEKGILPFRELLHSIQPLTWSSWIDMPTLFLFYSSDTSFIIATIIGAVCALLLFVGVMPKIMTLILFILYLSLFHAGQIFLSFQWDRLLLEAGVLAIFLVSGPSLLILLMYEWLLFRFRFLSGLSKLLSNDPSWHHFSALNYYFETQPLPHIGSWYAHFLPQWCHIAGVGLTFFTELIVPFFIFLPRKFKITAALITIFMQVLILMTSNHAFVNLLVIALCILLLDDDFLRRLMPKLRLNFGNRSSATMVEKSLIILLSIAILVSSMASSYMLVTQKMVSQKLFTVVSVIHRFGVGYSYHIFPTMQTTRQELIIQGSVDGKNWRNYQFKYKPDMQNKSLSFIVPHHPRLDWMMWFVPTQAGNQLFWFRKFLYRLKRGSPVVLSLLKANPFPGKSPRYLRVKVYQYKFNNPEKKRETGQWWQRKYIGVFPYVPPRHP